MAGRQAGRQVGRQADGKERSEGRDVLATEDTLDESSARMTRTRERSVREEQGERGERGRRKSGGPDHDDSDKAGIGRDGRGGGGRKRRVATSDKKKGQDEKGKRMPACRPRRASSSFFFSGSPCSLSTGTTWQQSPQPCTRTHISGGGIPVRWQGKEEENNKDKFPSWFFFASQSTLGAPPLIDGWR